MLGRVKMDELYDILMKIGIKKASVGIKLEDEIYEIAELFYSL